MGCDYYCTTVLDIDYQNETRDRVEVSRDRGYVGDFDADEDDFQSQLAKAMERRSERKRLFEKGQWLIGNPKEYVNLLSSRGVSLDQVRVVNKVIFCEAR